MSSVTLMPSVLKGTLPSVPSKSVAHRGLICAFLSGGNCTVSNLPDSEDIKATLRCLKALGAQIQEEGNSVKFLAFTEKASSAVADCGESGSTLRFLIPVAAFLGVDTLFVGGGRLPYRTLNEYITPLQKGGADIVFTEEGKYLPAKVQGKLKVGLYEIDGSVSSQFITGLLLACPIAENHTEIKVSGEITSSPYIDITLDIMKSFGVTVEKREKGFFISGNQKYKPTDYTVEGDWSSAAFWLTANRLGCSINLTDLKSDSKQGDREICSILDRIFTSDAVIDCHDVPDLVPVAAVAAALSVGRTTFFTGCGRLRHKESDRLQAIYENLSALGADISIDEDSITLRGKSCLKGGNVKGFNDHRIVMSMAIAALGCRNNVSVTDMGAVAKSYPHFFEDYRLLGGKII